MPVIYSSNWPQIHVKNFIEAVMVETDLTAYENGEITADDFIELWGIHPDNNYVITMEV